MKLELIRNENLINAYREALIQKQMAESNFNYAENQFIDVAIYELNAATQKVSVLVKQMKEEGVEYENSINL